MGIKHMGIKDHLKAPKDNCACVCAHALELGDPMYGLWLIVRTKFADI